MTDPREQEEQQASAPQAEAAQDEQVGDLDARVEEADQVKGGRKIQEDPCQGGEISSRLRK